MHVEHMSNTATPEEIFKILERDGCVVIDNLFSSDKREQINREMASHLVSAEPGVDEFDGKATRRTGALVARSPGSRELIMDPTVLDVAGKALSHAHTFQLHCTQVISIGPGSEAQPIHRDQWAFDMFPFPAGFDTTFATMWALTDFTEENGATRVIPGSHKFTNNKKFSVEDTIPAEMSAGSVLLYSGSLYHGGGINISTEDRVGVIVHYCLGWLRQEENQYLSVPQDMFKDLPEDLLRLMGYAKGSYSLGFIDAGQDPIAAIRPDLEQRYDGSEK